jgi:hypothetical protein
MIGYALLDDVIPPPPIQAISPVVTRRRKKKTEDTECNYLILFFIAGVFALAVSDQIKKN